MARWRSDVTIYRWVDRGVFPGILGFLTTFFVMCAPWLIFVGLMLLACPGPGRGLCG